METNGNKDERLWNMAKKRAAFKRNLYSYIVINVFLWLLWWFTSGRHDKDGDYGMPWPAWVTLGWGIGVAFNYFDAYHRSGSNLEEREYDKLKRKNEA